MTGADKDADIDTDKDAAKPLRTIRIWIALFIVGLVVSGVTAFPLLWELNPPAGWMTAIDTSRSIPAAGA